MPRRLVLWNVSRPSDPMYATKRYEDVLYEGLDEELAPWEVVRIQRREGAIAGSVPVSWLTRYWTKSADIVHATFQTLAPAAYVHRPKRLVVTVHDLTPLVYPGERDDPSLRLQWALTCRALGRADAVIAISAFTKRELLRLTDVAPRDVEVVPQGVDLDHYHPRDQASSRRRFGLDPDGQYVLVVSSTVPHKRLDVVPEVIAHVRQTMPNARLIKAGYGEDIGGPAVESLGWVPEADMPELYSAADVYLHPSEYEGFGLPVLEALACGRPVVAREAASLPEVVGDRGNLVPFDAGPRELAEQVVEALRRPVPAEQAREQAAKFPWSQTVQQTAAVYESRL